MACALPSCNQKGANTCGTCRKVFYCTREHQIDDWPRHKLNCVAPVPRKTGTDGYPAEELVVLFPKLDEAGSNFMDVLPPNKARNPTHLPLLFRSVLEREQLALKGKAIVDRATFKRQFSALTSNLFDSFPEKLWENVLIAGGSVLAALLPLDNGFANRRPPLTASRYYHYDFRPLGWSEKRKSMQDFMLTCRWPSGDVDIFLYGLKGQQATSKMIEIFTFLKSRFVELSGSSEGSDCVFIKTENTVTMETGSPRRKIQVILREYKSKEEALNEFDLDCVCVGYDGREVLATPRALKAISTRVNVVDLSIRGTAYESRLLKYAERGFAVAIPGLDLSMVDKGHLVLKREPTYWNKDEDALTSDSWDRWTEAENLLRLLLGDAIATSEGYIEFPFPGRMRRAHGMEERIDSWSLRLFDNYPGTRRGVRDWPATMKLSEFRAAKGPFAISWKEGSMPRQPLPFDKWSEGCFKGSTRPLTYKESWRERFAARSKDKKEEAAKPASADQAAEPPKPARAPTPDIPAPVISPRVLAAEAWVVAFKTLLPEVREASSEAVAELYRRLHPSSALPAVNLAWEKLEEFKDSEGGVSRTTQREPVKPVAAARSIAPSRRRGTEPRVWLANRVFRELKEHDESLLKKLQEIFEDSRGIWQAGKKVADGVFEGRLSDRARFFFLQLDSAPPSFLVTAVTLTHKGINKLITHSMELAKKVREAPGTAIAEGRSEMDAEIAEHARLTLSVMRSFREDAGKVSWFLPRLHLGNLEMIVEIGRDGTAVPLLTEQEMEALDMALKQGCVVVVKGSAGNGKTTVLGEIAAQVDGSLLCLPSERHKAQVLRTYPTVRALTVRERLEEIWPRDWRRVTFADFIEAKKAKLEKSPESSVKAGKGAKKPKDKALDPLAAWRDRFSDPDYFAFKASSGRKAEEDLWNHLVEQFSSGPADEVKRKFAPTLIDEGQSMTSTELKILALASGSPQNCVVGMDSKQSVGNESAGRRAAVKSAIFAALQAANYRNQMETHTVALTVNFRCPVGVLRALRGIIERWLKPFKDFDDFAVDTVVRSSLWDSPPVFVTTSLATVKQLLARLAMPTVVLQPDDRKVSADMDSLGLVLSMSECRGLEFDELIVLSSPLSAGTIKSFKEAATNLQSESWRSNSVEAQAVKDTLTTLIVMLTRARFGVIWFEKDLHHPLLDDLRAGDEPCIRVIESESDVNDAAALLSKARKDTVEDDSSASGSRSLTSMFSRVMEVIVDSVDDFKPIDGPCVQAKKLTDRILDVDSSAKAGVGKALDSLPGAVLAAQLLREPTDKDKLAIPFFGEVLGGAFLAAMEALDPQPPSEPYTRVVRGCADLCTRLGRAGQASRFAAKI